MTIEPRCTDVYGYEFPDCVLPPADPCLPDGTTLYVIAICDPLTAEWTHSDFCAAWPDHPTCPAVEVAPPPEPRELPKLGASTTILALAFACCAVGAALSRFTRKGCNP